MSKVSVWDHIVDAWEGRERKDVLILVIDQIMGEHRPKTYRNISDFFGLQLDQSVLDRVCAEGTIGRMVSRISRFQNRWLRNIQKKKKFGSRVVAPLLSSGPAKVRAF